MSSGAQTSLEPTRRPRPALRAVAWVGGGVRQLGALALFVRQILLALPRTSGRELLRALWSVGAESLPLAVATAVTTGLMMVLQTASFVRAFGVTRYLGWATGYATLREFVPLMVGLLYSGRVGASQASELAALRAGGQFEALEALGADLPGFLLAPRFLAMSLSLVLVTGLCDLVALGAAALFAWWLVEVPPPAFFESLTGTLQLGDALEGLGKALAFGITIAIAALSLGLRTPPARDSGARAVGRSARRTVVISMVAILILDAILTGLAG